MNEYYLFRFIYLIFIFLHHFTAKRGCEKWNFAIPFFTAPLSSRVILIQRTLYCLAPPGEIFQLPGHGADVL